MHDDLRSLVGLLPADFDFVVPFPAGPEPHQRRLLAALGVRWEINPRRYALMAAPVNVGVRASEGVDGTIVVTAAWCETCRLESMPNVRGCCSFCGSTIVDEDTLPARGLLDRSRRDPRPVGDAASPSSPGKAWTRERIIQRIRSWTDAYGGPPAQTDWSGPTTDDRPNFQLVARLFARDGEARARGWGNAIEAAGFPRPTKGSRSAYKTGPAAPSRVSSTSRRSGPAAAAESGASGGASAAEESGADEDATRSASASTAAPLWLPTPPDVDVDLAPAISAWIAATRDVLDTLERLFTGTGSRPPLRLVVRSLNGDDA